MKIISYFIIMMLTILLILTIGCFEDKKSEVNNDANQNDISWEIIDCNKISKNFMFNWTDDFDDQNYSKITSTISNVSLTIQNTGNILLNLKVDFEFIITEINKDEDTEIQKITSKKCSCDSLEYNNGSYYSYKYINLNPGEIKTLYYTLDFDIIYGYKINEWCYQITPI